MPLPFNIGKLTIDPPLILAPMAGITSRAYRQLVRENNPGAVGLFYSEFASVEGLIRHNEPTMRLITRAATDRATLFAAQIFGADPDHMREGAIVAQGLGADIIDINAGCPAPKVVKKGGGSELLKKLPLLGRIVAAVKSGIQVPLMVKIRIGWDPDTINVLETIRILEDNGADGVTIHGRTRVQSFKGEADWQWVREARTRLKIPVIGNGDILTPDQALSRFSETGANGVMIGRGVMRDPWLFQKIKAGLNGGECADPFPQAQKQIFKRYYEILQQDGLPDKAMLGVLKQLAVKYLRGLPNGADIRTAALRTMTCDAFFAQAERYFDVV